MTAISEGIKPIGWKRNRNSLTDLLFRPKLLLLPVFRETVDNCFALFAIPKEDNRAAGIGEKFNKFLYLNLLDNFALATSIL